MTTDEYTVNEDVDVSVMVLQEDSEPKNMISLDALRSLLTENQQTVSGAVPSSDTEDGTVQGTQEKGENTADSVQLFSVDGIGEDDDIAGICLDILEKLEDAAADREVLEGMVQDIHAHYIRPALETDFEDYTVTETLLLLILLYHVITSFFKIIKGGFSWLM